MSFLDAVNKGVEKAKEVDVAKSEVDAIFSEINSQLSLFNRSCSPKVMRHVPKIEIKEGTFATISAGGDDLMPESAIVLRVKYGVRTEEVVVAEWEQHVNGFPCTLSFAGENYICMSGEDLRSAFEQLLMTGSFGRSLLDAIDTVKGAKRQ